MDEAEDSTVSSVVNLAADGDVILVVGPEEVKLRVHSLFLKAVSKPFSALFGLHWKEGQNMLDRDGPVELLLPEDNAGALTLICSIVHHQNNNVPRTLATGDVLAVAVTADKYDCVDALKFASGIWLRPGDKEARELMLLTAAAYLFQNAAAFYEVTRALVLNYHGPYLDLCCEEVESAMTWKVFCLLEAKRSIARLELAETLIAGINEGTGTCSLGCGWTSEDAYEYLELLETKALLPAKLVGVSISSAIEVAKEMPGPIFDESVLECTCGYDHSAPESREDRCKRLDVLNDEKGLCLRCIRSGSTASDCNHDSYGA